MTDAEYMLVQLARASFLTSAPTLALCPAPTGHEVAFAGRSNAGKSSAINALANQTRDCTALAPIYRYLSRLYADDANDAAAPGYVVAALSAGYVKRLGDWDLSAYARVDNLFDRRYAGSVIVNESNGRYYEPAPGRSVGVGMGVMYRY